MLIEKRFRSQDGGALVEFAVVMPLLFLLLFGFVEFGVLLHNQQVITNASREVARAAITPVPKLSPGQAADAASPYNDRLIRFGTSELISVTLPNANRVYPDEIVITATWNHRLLVPAFFGLGPTITLDSQTSVRMM
jgi:hypothetical protein